MIKEIYHGDFRPVDNMGMSENYQDKRRIAYELSKQFEGKIKLKRKNEYKKIQEAYMDVLIAGIEEGYISGFNNGIKLIIEAVTGNNL